ncbi:MAG: 2-oxo acid dehydrogenase subunit E2 [Roseiflexaceae bacterium]|nr:2-oxo acid dehydrogenase subunit E2 [Roseiflexaceae bacterium]
MTTDINMPQLGESVIEGTISRWLKQPGERVEKYEALLEVMTDKVDTEVPAPEAGVLRTILVAEGETVRVGTLIAVLDGDAAASAQPDPAPPIAPLVQPIEAAAQAAFVSPVVARLTAEHGISIAQVSGSGAGGRVTKKDVLNFVQHAAEQSARTELATSPTVAPPELQAAAISAPPAAAPATISQPPPTPASAQETPTATDPLPEDALPEDAQLVPLSPMRRAIAEHMTRSVRTAPQVTTVVEVDMGAATLHRAHNKAAFERQGVNLTFTAYLAQAVCVGLRAVPVLNGSFSEQGTIQHSRIHLGMAVALDDGLLVPVIRDADEKNLLGLARAINDLAVRGRGRRLRPEEMQDGTFTLTNHGVSGSLFATPIINQPQGGILGVGAIQKRAVVVSQQGVDAIAIRPMCYLSLTFDHRLIDGSGGDAFLVAVKAALESVV